MLASVVPNSNATRPCGGLLMGVVKLLRHEFIPWTRGRMFRSGIPLGQPIELTNRVVTVANGITVIRLLGLVPFVYLTVVRHSWLLAFLLCWLFGVLDTLDGYVARRFNQVSKLGSALDPATDRLTVIVVVITLAVVGIIPWWLLAMVAVRDVLLAALFLTLKGTGRPTLITHIPVTRASKLATMALLAGISLLVLAKVGISGGTMIRNVAVCLTLGGLALCYVALGQYAKVGFARSRQ
jgi:cardiolipin synthase (CMP-forming)